VKQWTTTIGFGVLALLSFGSELMNWFERGLPGNLGDFFL